MKPDQERMTTLLAESILELCKVGLRYKHQFSVRGLLGITLDDEEVFLVDIHEKLGKNVEKSDESEANIEGHGSVGQKLTNIEPPVRLPQESDSVHDDANIQHAEAAKSLRIACRTRKRSGSPDRQTIHGRESEQAYMSYKMRASSVESLSTTGQRDPSDSTDPLCSKEQKIQRETDRDLNGPGAEKRRKIVKDEAECELDMDVVDEASSELVEEGSISAQPPATVGASNRTNSNTETDSSRTDSILHGAQVKMEHNDEMAISETAHIHVPVKQEPLHGSDVFQPGRSPEMVPVIPLQSTSEPQAGCSNWEAQGPIQNADVNMQFLYKQEWGHSLLEHEEDTAEDVDMIEVAEGEDWSGSGVLVYKQQGEKQYSNKANKATIWALKRFDSWAKSHDISVNWETVTPTKLSCILQKFYKELKAIDGSPLTPSTMTGIRAGIFRHLKSISSKQSINILTDKEFDLANKTFVLKCKSYQDDHAKHAMRQVISDEDIDKLRIYFSSGFYPYKLVEFVWFHISFHFGRRGRDSYRVLRKDSFVFDHDEFGHRYLRLSSTEKKGKASTRREQAWTEIHSQCMYETDGSMMDPCVVFELYLTKLHPRCEFLFQTPAHKSFCAPGTWYRNEPMGKNTIGRIMPTLSKNAGLSQVYGNCSVQESAKSMSVKTINTRQKQKACFRLF